MCIRASFPSGKRFSGMSSGLIKVVDLPRIGYETCECACCGGVRRGEVYLSFFRSHPSRKVSVRGGYTHFVIVNPCKCVLSNAAARNSVLERSGADVVNTSATRRESLHCVF